MAILTKFSVIGTIKKDIANCNIGRLVNANGILVTIPTKNIMPANRMMTFASKIGLKPADWPFEATSRYKLIEREIFAYKNNAK